MIDSHAQELFLDLPQPGAPAEADDDEDSDGEGVRERLLRVPIPSPSSAPVVLEPRTNDSSTHDAGVPHMSETLAEMRSKIEMLKERLEKAKGTPSPPSCEPPKSSTTTRAEEIRQRIDELKKSLSKEFLVVNY